MNPAASKQSDNRASPNLDSTGTRLRKLEADSKTHFEETKEALSRAGQQVGQFQSSFAKANILADEAKATANAMKSQANKALERASEAAAEANKLKIDVLEVRKALAVVEKTTGNLGQTNIDNGEVIKTLAALEKKVTDQKSLLGATNSSVESITSRFAEFVETYNERQKDVEQLSEGLARLENDYVSKEMFKIGFEQFTTLKQTIEERFKALEMRPSPNHIDHEGSAVRTSIEPILDRLSKLEEIVEEERKIAESRQSVAQIRLSDNTQLQSDLKAQVGKLQLQANASTHATTNIIPQVSKMVEDFKRTVPARDGGANNHLIVPMHRKVDHLEQKISGIDISIKALDHRYNNLTTESLARHMLDVLEPWPAKMAGQLANVKADITALQAADLQLVTEMKERQAELAAYRKTQGVSDAAKISKSEVMALLDEVVEASKQRHEKLVDDVKNEKTLLKYQLHELQAITQKQTPVLKELKASVASAEERIIQCQERITGFEAQDSLKPMEDTTPTAVKQLMSKSLLKRSSAEKIVASRSSSKQSSSTSSRNATPTDQHKKPDPKIAKGTLPRQESSGGASKRAKDSRISTIEQTSSNKNGSGARTFLMLDGATSTPTPEVAPTPSTDESDDDLIPRLARQAKPNTTRLVGEPEDESSTPPSAQRPGLDENYLEQWTKPIRKRKVINSSDPIVADGDTIEVDQSQSPPDLTQNEPVPDIPSKRRMSSGDEEYVRPKPKKTKKVSLKH